MPVLCLCVCVHICEHARVYVCVHMPVCVWGEGPALTVPPMVLLGPGCTSARLLRVISLPPHPPSQQSMKEQILITGTWGPSHFFHLIRCELNSLSLSFPSCERGHVEGSSSEAAMSSSLVLCPQHGRHLNSL